MCGGESLQLQRIREPRILRSHELVPSANSDSTKANVQKACTLMNEFALMHVAADSKYLTSDSSDLVLSFWLNIVSLALEKR